MKNLVNKSFPNRTANWDFYMVISRSYVNESYAGTMLSLLQLKNLVSWGNGDCL